MRSPNRPLVGTNFSISKPASSAKTDSLLLTNLSSIPNAKSQLCYPQLLLEATANPPGPKPSAKQQQNAASSRVFWQQQASSGETAARLPALRLLLFQPGYITLNSRLFAAAR